MMRYYLEKRGWISPNGESGKGKNPVIQGLRRESTGSVDLEVASCFTLCKLGNNFSHVE